jgi:glycosyl hydrolase family 12
MKHRAKTKRRFGPAVAAAVLVASVGGGTAVLVGNPGHDGAQPAVVSSSAAARAQMLSALKHRTRHAAPRHRHEHKPKPSPTRTSASPRPTTPSPHPTTPSPRPTTPKPDPTTSSPAPSTPAPAPSSSSPSASPTGAKSFAWCSTAAFGTFNTSDGFDLYNNEWNGNANPGPQKICGNNGHDWQVTSTQRANNTEVLTYPSVQKNYPNRALSSFTSMTSSYAENMNSAAGTDAEAAYDIWINDLNKEVMFWVDNHGQTPAGKKVATVTFGGLTWNLWEESGYYAFVLDHNATSGTVDLLAGIKYLISRGDLSASDKLWQVNFGWEICSTAGVAQTFTMSNFTLAGN